MMCTDCGRTDRPNTLVMGSDLLELVGWCLFLVPGLLYCWWRRASCRKVCAHCGSLAVIRQSRAARDRGVGEGEPSQGGRIVYAARPIGWLRTPTERLRSATRGGALVSVLVCAWAVTSLDLLEVRPEPPPAPPAAAEEPEVPLPSPESVAAAAQARARAEARAQRDPADRQAVRRFVRRRECEKLCTEFHGSRGRSHRECLRKCVAELETTSSDPKQPECQDFLDPETCLFGSSD